MPSRFLSTLDMSVLSLPISLAHMSESSSTLSRSKLGLSYRVRHESNLVDGIIFPISPAYPSYISPVESTRNPTLPYSSCCWATAAAYLRLQPRVRFRHHRRSSASSSTSHVTKIYPTSHTTTEIYPTSTTTAGVYPTSSWTKHNNNKDLPDLKQVKVSQRFIQT